MARTATRRPQVRRPAELTSAPNGQLPPRRVTWPRDSVLVVAAGLALFGAAPLTGRPAWANPVLAAALTGSIAVAILGRRTVARQKLTDRLVEALTPGLGLRQPDRRSVTVRSWSRGWIGIPRRIELRYAPLTDDTDSLWRAELIAACSRRLLAEYELRRHDRRRCRLSLKLVPHHDKVDIPQVQVRAERAVLEMLGPTASVTAVQWNDAGDLAGLEATHQAGPRLAAAPYRHRIERVVSTMLPGRWRAHWDLELDSVRFELRPAMPQVMPHPPVDVDESNLFRIPLGVDEDGESVLWDLRSMSPHLMIVGKTGSGKTVVINGVVMEIAARGWQVWIIDPKRIEFLGLRGYPNVQVIATTVPDQVAVVYQAWQEMERRYALIEAGEAVEADLEPLLVVLDEYRDFYASVSEWYAGIKITGMPAQCPVFEKFSSIARKGRSARIHAVLGTQRPDAAFLTGEMRDNFAARISLGPLSPQGAMMMWEAPHIGVAVPRIAGRGTALDAHDRAVEVQAYWTPDPRRNNSSADLDVLAQLRPAESLHVPLQVWMDQELFEGVDEKGRSQVWKAVQRAELRPVLDSCDAAAAETVAEDQLSLTKSHPGGERAHSTAPILTSSLAGPPHPMLLPSGGFSTRAGSDLWSEARPAPSGAEQAADPGQHDGAVVLRLDRKHRADKPDRAPAMPIATAPPAAAAGSDPAAPSDENSDDDQHEAPAALPAAQVQPGDLVLLEDTGIWATVEAAEFDVLDEDYICVDWRTDDDDAGSMSVPQDDEIPTRRALVSTWT